MMMIIIIIIIVVDIINLCCMYVINILNFASGNKQWFSTLFACNFGLSLIECSARIF